MSGKRSDDLNHQSIHKILDCFFSECEREFAFLEKEFEFFCLSGIVKRQGDRDIILPYNAQEIQKAPDATVRYESDPYSLSLSFKNNCQMLDAQLYNGEEQVDLHDILQALKSPASSRFLQSKQTTQKDVRRFIRNIAKVVHAHAERIFVPDSPVIKKAKPYPLNKKGKKFQKIKGALLKMPSAWQLKPFVTKSTAAS